MTTPYFIGAPETGLQDSIEPFYLPEDAYVELEDAHVWRGRLKRKPAHKFLGNSMLESRLRILIGNTQVAQNATGTIPTTPKVGQSFSIGTAMYTKNSDSRDLLSTLDGSTATLETDGSYTITNVPRKQNIYFYPAKPVMGILSRQTESVNMRDVIAFDTQFSYIRRAGGWIRLDENTTWTGRDNNFFWGTHYQGTNAYEDVLYVTNNVDNIRYIERQGTAWTALRPEVFAGTFMETAKMILPFQNRLLAFDTLEGENRFNSRIRWSRPLVSPLNNEAFRTDISGRGGFLDASTEENIISVRPLKNKIIVYFEKSTWELVYTTILSQPFSLRKINTELGVESTFSSVSFDTSVLGFGNVGVHGCNGVNVSRIDDKIPDQIFSIHNGDTAVDRVYGVRDFYNETVYWTFPNFKKSAKVVYPNQVLSYNYANDTWAVFNDSYTCFGLYQKEDGLRWRDAKFSWRSAKGIRWNSNRLQEAFQQVAAGNQQGFTFLLERNFSSNDSSLYITDVTAGSQTTIKSINHNLTTKDYIQLKGVNGIDNLNGNIFKVLDIIDEDSFVIDATTTGTYLGGGEIATVSNLRVTTKQFQPTTSDARQFSVPYIDFLLSQTRNGEVTLNYTVDTHSRGNVHETAARDALLGSNVLYTQPESGVFSEMDEAVEWHRYYIQSEAKFLQLQFSLSDQQLRNPVLLGDDFEIHGMILHIKTQGRLIG